MGEMHKPIAGIALSVIKRTTPEACTQRFLGEDMGTSLSRLATYLLMWDVVRNALPEIARRLGVAVPSIQNTAKNVALDRAVKDYSSIVGEGTIDPGRLGFVHQVISLHDKMVQVLEWVDEMKALHPEKAGELETEFVVSVTQESVDKKIKELTMSLEPG